MTRTNPRLGVSFLEIMITLLIVAVLTGFATVYYQGLILEGERERARIDLREIKKAILKLESDHKITIRPPGEYPSYVWPPDVGGRHIYMEKAGSGVNEYPPEDDDPVQHPGFRLPVLLEFRLLSKIPLDPWGWDYRIDIPEGIIYSLGRDGEEQTGDEVEVSFRPPFEALRAYEGTGDRTITVDFSRKVDPFTILAPTSDFLPFQVWDGGGWVNLPDSAVPAEQETTASRDMINAFSVNIRFKEPLPANFTEVRVVDRVNVILRAMDTGRLENLDVGIPIDGR